MQYDPIKYSLGKVFKRTPFLRKLFYSLLDLLLLRAWHINKALKQWKNESKVSCPSILDAGAGFGQYTYRLSKYFPDAEIKGIDIKQEQIDDCNSFFSETGAAKRVVFEYADLTKFKEPDKYDLIISVDVMEHILKDEIVFNNFASSLKKGGTLMVSTPSDKGGSDSHHHDDDSHGFIDEHVRDGYSVNDITEKLQKAGFSEIDTKYTYGTPGSIAWKLSMKYPIKLLGLSKLFFIVLPFYYLVTFPFSAFLNYLDVVKNHNSGTGLFVKATKQ